MFNNIIPRFPRSVLKLGKFQMFTQVSNPSARDPFYCFQKLIQKQMHGLGHLPIDNSSKEYIRLVKPPNNKDMFKF